MVVLSFKEHIKDLNLCLYMQKKIWGLSKVSSNSLCVKFGFKKNYFFNSLNDQNKKKLKYFLNKKYFTNDEKKKIYYLSWLLKTRSDSWQGKRLLLKLPSKGQRSKTNAKTSKKGLVVKIKNNI